MIKTINTQTEDIEFSQTTDGTIAVGSKTTVSITITERHRSDKNIQKQMIQALIEALAESIK